MTGFTPQGFAAKLAELAVAVREAERAALQRSAALVKARAQAEIGGTGDIRGTVEHIVVDNEAHVGSNGEVAGHHELGTMHRPPHSFLASALVHEIEEVVRIVGDGVVDALIGRRGQL